MSNKHSKHPKNDKHDHNFLKHVEKSTYNVQHELAELPDTKDNVPDLESLFKNNNQKN